MGGHRVLGRAGAASFATGVVLLVLGLIAAPGAGAKPPGLDAFSLVLTTHVAAGDTTTYVWTLVGPAGEGVSHVLIDPCLGAGASGDFSEPWRDANPPTGRPGYKWEAVPDVFVGSMFTLTYPGEHDADGRVSFTLKKAGGNLTLSAAGPSCPSTPPTTVPEITTTTVPGATTVPAPTTTTTPEATTTTTTAPAGSTTTVAVLGVTSTTEVPHPVVVESTTTTDRSEVLGERVRSVPEELPFTGRNSRMVAGIGATLMAAGAALMVEAKHLRRAARPG